jgi:hypothetical protein
MTRHINRAVYRRAKTLVCGLAFCAASTVAAFGANGEAVPPMPHAQHEEIRRGGVLEESYNYHRHGAEGGVAARPTITPSGGWYGYGFPVSSHRWGWFGAERYYPRVLWHRGYNGDHSRWSYRRGY